MNLLCILPFMDTSDILKAFSMVSKIPRQQINYNVVSGKASLKVSNVFQKLLPATVVP